MFYRVHGFNAIEIMYLREAQAPRLEVRMCLRQAQAPSVVINNTVIELVEATNFVFYF